MLCYPALTQSSIKNIISDAGFAAERSLLLRVTIKKKTNSFRCAAEFNIILMNISLTISSWSSFFGVLQGGGRGEETKQCAESHLSGRHIHVLLRSSLSFVLNTFSRLSVEEPGRTGRYCGEDHHFCACNGNTAAVLFVSCSQTNLCSTIHLKQFSIVPRN